MQTIKARLGERIETIIIFQLKWANNSMRKKSSNNSTSKTNSQRMELKSGMCYGEEKSEWRTEQKRKRKEISHYWVD